MKYGGQRVMLDYDIAELYQIATKVLNQSVKRNIDRFPEDFMFRLSIQEWERMRSQFVTASQKKRNANTTPYAFTEHGVTMLASVLKSTKAVQMNIAIVRAFISIRQYINTNFNLNEKLHQIRNELKTRIDEHDTQLAHIYDALENLLDKKQDEQDKKQNWEDRERIGFKK